MSNITKWVLQLDLTDEQYKKLVRHLGDSLLYDFDAEPMYMMESTTSCRVTVTCSWTNNLKYLTEWIDKNISDSLDK